MEQNTSLKSFIKSIPILGSTAKLANKSRIYLRDLLYADRRKNALLRMKHRASWYVLRNPQSQKQFIQHRPMVTPTQRELVESLGKTGVAAKNVDQAGIDPAEWSRLQAKVDEFARLSAERITAATTNYSDKLEPGFARAQPGAIQALFPRQKRGETGRLHPQNESGKFGPPI